VSDDRIPSGKVAVLGMVTIAAYGCWHYAFGVLLDPIIEDTRWSEPFLTSAFGASVLLGGIGSVLGGWLLDRIGSRMVFLLAALFGTVGFAVATTTSSAGLFAASTAIGGGAIGALGFYHITQTVAVRISPRSSSKAIAVLTVWGAFASAVYLPSTAWLVGRFGWRPALAVIGFSAVAAFAWAAVVLDTRTRSMPPSLHIVSEMVTALRSPDARSFFASQAVVGVAMGVVLAYQVPAMTAAGLPLAAASFWAGFRGFAQLLGRIPLMPLVRRFGVVRSMRISYVAIGIGSVALAFAGSPAIAAVYAVIAGFGIGAISPLIGIHSRDVFGADSLGTGMGMVSLVFQVVAAAGPPLAGWLAVSTGSRAYAVMGAGVLALLAAATIRSPRVAPAG
jgi:predicted MFS family arabinose efflux permease